MSAAAQRGLPERETETTPRPAFSAAWQTRVPTKPLPPKTRRCGSEEEEEEDCEGGREGKGG